MNHPDATGIGRGTRHAAPDAVDLMWAGGAPMVLPITGAPWCELRLDPEAGELTLRTEYAMPAPNLAKLRNISCEAIVHNGAEVSEVSVIIGTNPRGAYALLTAIADEMQLRQLPLARAVQTSVEQHKDILASHVALSTEAEKGLYGELLFVEHLFAALGPARAVDAWQGPLGEEHDFVLPSTCVEVKTTSSERRRHVIHGLNQLVCDRDRQLLLLSIQITRATREYGRRLPDLVHALREASGESNSFLNRRLLKSGWRDEDSSLYESYWILRTLPKAIIVDEEFPALTPDRVNVDLGIVDEVSYRIDVSGLPAATGPVQVSEFVRGVESE